jgi:hypothetical protein
MTYIFTEEKCQDNRVAGTDWVLGHGHSIHSLLEFAETDNPRKLAN